MLCYLFYYLLYKGASLCVFYILDEACSNFWSTHFDPSLLYIPISAKSNRKVLAKIKKYISSHVSAITIFLNVLHSKKLWEEYESHIRF